MRVEVRLIERGRIEVPAGVFQDALCVEVSRTLTRLEDPDPYRTGGTIRLEWFAPGVGWVQGSWRDWGFNVIRPGFGGRSLLCYVLS